MRCGIRLRGFWVFERQMIVVTRLGRDAMNDRKPYERLEITKEDGRYLVYYHFPDSADSEQTEAFQEASKFSMLSGHTVTAAPDEPGERSSP